MRLEMGAGGPPHFVRDGEPSAPLLGALVGRLLFLHSDSSANRIGGLTVSRMTAFAVRDVVVAGDGPVAVISRLGLVRGGAFSSSPLNVGAVQST